MKRTEVGNGVWWATMLGLPALNTTLIYVFGPAAALAGVLLAVELALVGTRLRDRRGIQLLFLLVLVALGIAASTVILLVVAFVPYVVVVCSTSAQPCFS
jgi:hypothetical protein